MTKWTSLLFTASVCPLAILAVISSGRFFAIRLIMPRHTDFDSLRGMRVSSHLLIRRTGQIQQFVPFHQRAWHAGQSSFDGRNNCNDFSLGIELEGTDTGQFNEIQYARLGETCRCLADAYAIPVKNIVGHSDIAPGRKTDPGVGFDWARLHRLMAG